MPLLLGTTVLAAAGWRWVDDTTNNEEPIGGPPASNPSSVPGETDRYYWCFRCVEVTP